MIADLKPYSEYTASGLGWLGQVPAHWTTRRLRASITDCVNGVWGADPNGEDDLVCVRAADFDRVNLRVSLKKKTLRAIPQSARARRVLNRGDLLLEKSGGGDLQPVGAVVCYDHDEPAVCSNFVARMPVAHGYNNYFLNYLHFTLYAYRVNVRSIKQTTGIQNLDGHEYLSESVAFPPLSEQVAIVRFLDWATGRLERTIRAKRKVIALIKEQKQAIIHRAVTHGLDPFAPLKSSNIPWLGDTPQHWELVPTRAFLRLRKQVVGDRSKQYTLLSLTLRGVIARDMDNPAGKWPASFATYQEVEAGNLIFCLFDIDETPRFVGLSQLTGMITGAYTVFRCKDPETAKWLYQFYLAMDFDKRLKPAYTGLRKVIQKNTFLGLKVPIPPVHERATILSHIAAETAAIETTISRLEREIELLREYRTRLVADVVTGKLDVREAAARLPEEATADAVQDDAALSDDETEQPTDAETGEGSRLPAAD